MKNRSWLPYAVLTSVFCLLVPISHSWSEPPSDLDDELRATLRRAGLTGTIQSSLEPRLGRNLDQSLANLGRLLWFDKEGGLHNHNTCGRVSFSPPCIT